MTTDQTNIISIAESSSPLRIVLERRAQIKRRIEEIKAQRNALTLEENELYRENSNLKTAEDAIKALLERNR